MNDLAIRCEGVSKQYRIGPRERYKALRDVLAIRVQDTLRRLRSAPKNSADRNRDNTLWALIDVSFEIEEGEVVGIIGRNGAGKSTLLKILSRITRPTSGLAYIHGRVGSLLEVGTGFHPELTGRENLYLNGAILGMRRSEISRKFDEIVSFAGVERFLDTPVKHYSSGMRMRLAFAVASHLEPEILLVDEVLAVGDANFQEKCLGKMNEVARMGRTVLFISHNMTAINQLCPRTILLADGQVVRDGQTPEVIAEHLKGGSHGGSECVWDDPHSAPGNDHVRLRAVRVISQGEMKSEVDIDKEVRVEVEFWNYVEGARNLSVVIYLIDGNGTIVLSTGTTPGANSLREEWFDRPHPVGLFQATCTLPANFLNDTVYFINAYVVTLGPIVVEASALHVISFKVFDTGVMREAGGGQRWDGLVRPRLPWRTEFIGVPEEEFMRD